MIYLNYTLFLKSFLMVFNFNIFYKSKRILNTKFLKQKFRKKNLPEFLFILIQTSSFLTRRTILREGL